MSSVTVTVSVLDVAVLNPFPPAIVRVSEPEVIVLLVPESAATSKEVATLAIALSV